MQYFASQRQDAVSINLANPGGLNINTSPGQRNNGSSAQTGLEGMRRRLNASQAVIWPIAVAQQVRKLR